MDKTPIKVATSIYGSIISWEYYRRELGLDLVLIEPQSLNDFKSLGTPFVLISNFEEWDYIFRNCPKQSLVVFATGNEYYDLQYFRKLDNYEAIKYAFVEYLPSVPSRNPLAYIYRFIFRDIRVILRKEFLFFLFRALRAYVGIKKLKLITPHFLLPIGYTDRFFNELQKIETMNSHDSLFSLKFGSQLNSRNVTPFFAGQKGSWFRRRTLSQFESRSASITKYPVWGGNLSSENSSYAQGMCNSIFVVCPPGNRSNETNRYYESIICGAIPLISTRTISDLLCFQYWTEESNFKNWTSLEIFDCLSKMPLLQLQDLAKRIKLHENLKFRELESRIRRIAAEMTLN
jgi:hypothetical protein